MQEQYCVKINKHAKLSFCFQFWLHGWILTCFFLSLKTLHCQIFCEKWVFEYIWTFQIFDSWKSLECSREHLPEMTFQNGRKPAFMFFEIFAIILDGAICPIEIRFWKVFLKQMLLFSQMLICIFFWKVWIYTWFNFDGTELL